MATALLWAAAIASAQQPAPETPAAQPPPQPAAPAKEEPEELIVTGTRVKDRAALDSLAPIDVIRTADLTDVGETDLSNLLRTAVPSYNVNPQPISDAATIVRPAKLRGLPPDSTLILANGKRRHRAAVIAFLGNGIADGSQGPDVSNIPTLALSHVEVLRDGAAAQYGSDAIAGVINFVLRDSAEGLELEGKWGQTYDGDGATWNLGGNIGLPLTEDGYANFTFEWREADDTNRSVQRSDAAALIAAGNTAVKNPAQI
jgi:iron complex outermembrane receptor protein